MKTRILTFLFATLPLALTAQATDISMDAGGMYGRSGSASHASGGNGDCASVRSLQEVEAAAANSDKQPRSSEVGSSAARRQVSDRSGQEAGAESATGGAAGASIAVPVKSRSTRWQSLVPGAIK